MGVREVIHKRKKLAAVLWSSVILLMAAVIAWELHSSSRSTSNNSFFTIDDGKTWFVADLDQIPPFEHQGKQAVRCFVYQAEGGKPFAGYLLKYTPTMKSLLEKATPDERERRAADLSGAMLKRPGQSEWISATDRNAPEIFRSIVGPAGERDALPVYP